jgi:hypothetical protein
MYEMKEIILISSQIFKNQYSEVSCWVQLTGPGFNKIYGFWKGVNNLWYELWLPCPDY